MSGGGGEMPIDRSVEVVYGYSDDDFDGLPPPTTITLHCEACTRLSEPVAPCELHTGHRVSRGVIRQVARDSRAAAQLLFENRQLRRRNRAIEARFLDLHLHLGCVHDHVARNFARARVFAHLQRLHQSDRRREIDDLQARVDAAEAEVMLLRDIQARHDVDDRIHMEEYHLLQDQADALQAELASTHPPSIASRSLGAAGAVSDNFTGAIPPNQGAGSSELERELAVALRQRDHARCEAREAQAAVGGLHAQLQQLEDERNANTSAWADLQQERHDLATDLSDARHKFEVVCTELDRVRGDLVSENRRLSAHINRVSAELASTRSDFARQSALVAQWRSVLRDLIDHAAQQMSECPSLSDGSPEFQAMVATASETFTVGGTSSPVPVGVPGNHATSDLWLTAGDSSRARVASDLGEDALDVEQDENNGVTFLQESNIDRQLPISSISAAAADNGRGSIGGDVLHAAACESRSVRADYASATTEHDDHSNVASPRTVRRLRRLRGRRLATQPWANAPSHTVTRMRLIAVPDNLLPHHSTSRSSSSDEQTHVTSIPGGRRPRRSSSVSRSTSTSKRILPSTLTPEPSSSKRPRSSTTHPPAGLTPSASRDTVRDSSSSRDPPPSDSPFRPAIPCRQSGEIPPEYDCTPWIHSEMAEFCLSTIDIDAVYGFLPPLGWGPPSPNTEPSSWLKELTAMDQVIKLYEARPWAALAQRQPDPISFLIDDPRFDPLVTAYRTLVQRHLQKIWELTHAVEIDQLSNTVDRSPTEITIFQRWFRSFRVDLKNHVSHLKKPWKAVLQVLVRLMHDGTCDLDVLLDPFFYLVASSRSPWYPRNLRPQGQPQPASLVEALKDLDCAEPWRNYFIDDLANHPSLSNLVVRERITGKFIPIE